MDGAQLLGGRYTLLDQIGVGGMAVVWRARDEVLGRTVAVKLLAGKHAGEPEARDRIKAEARAAAALSHPNIAQVYDYGEADEVPYVVMELVRGGTLQDRMDAGPMSPRFAMRVAAEVAAALAAAHADGLVHRDIKPANVMVTEMGAKVVDFGIAAAVNPAGTGDEDFEVLGTPAYLAPERLTGDGVEPASDIYALGILLYRMLSGHSPWSADTTTQMLSAHVYVDPEPLPPAPGVPDYVTALCNRCLSKDTTERPSAREVAALLAQGAGLRVVEDGTPPGPSGPGRDNEPSLLIRRRSTGGGTPLEGIPPTVFAASPTGPASSTTEGQPTGPAAMSGLVAGPPRPSIPAARAEANPSGPAARAEAGPAARAEAGPAARVEAGPAKRAETGPATRAKAGPAGPAGSGPAPAVAPGADPAARRRRLMVPALAVLVLLVLAGLVGWLLGPERDQPTAAPLADGASASSSAPTSAPSADGKRTRTASPTVTATTRRPAAGAPVTTPATRSVPPTSKPAPDPTPTRATPATDPPPVTRTFSSVAGTVRATCPKPAKAQLLSWSATVPWTIKKITEGPAAKAVAVFKNSGSRIRMVVTCADGVPSNNTVEN